MTTPTPTPTSTASSSTRGGVADNTGSPPNLGRPRRHGPANELALEEVLDRIQALPVWPHWSAQRQRTVLRAARRILLGLSSQPGTGWQQRWEAAGAETSNDWQAAVAAHDGELSVRARQAAKQGVMALMLIGAILPGYRFLIELRVPGWWLAEVRSVIAPEGFARVIAHAAELNLSPDARDLALLVLSKMVLHTGLAPEQLGVAELDEFHQAERTRINRVPPAFVAAWDLLRGCGLVPAGLGYRDHQRPGPQSTADLVDRHQLRCRDVRDVLVRYLDERRPGMDYKSFLNIVGHLVGAFWADIEAHHPEVTSLLLPDDVATAWKNRLRFTRGPKTGGRPRRDYLQHLMQVRAFYLDIAEWALQDPSWAPHAVRCPIRRTETKGVRKQRKQTIAAIHQRIRERLPQLPTLVETAHQHLRERSQLLAIAQAAVVDEPFEHQGRHYLRAGRRPDGTHTCEPATVVITDLATGDTLDARAEEDDAFWAWAVVEVLRHTGVRLEELLELSHLALVQHRLDDTGEVVPLLQVLPSKTDQERLLLVTPELASVLASIINRLRLTSGGHIPIIQRWDRHERTYTAALPYLFQRRLGHRHKVISVTAVQTLLNRTLARSGLRDAAGNPLRFTPHDFRRIFATDAVSGGLPVHIAARILGHTHIGSSEAYIAVFQDELIRTYRSYLAQRRAVRPEAEYRNPTADEWREFQQHFTLRKLELGSCARPYGTPCQHEHACVRCPMLQVDPRQRDRLAEIAHNLRERITEARQNNWLGEIEGLRISLRGAEQKLVALDRKSRPRTTNLAMPQVITRRPT